jgi:hypothetical protein
VLCRERFLKEDSLVKTSKRVNLLAIFGLIIPSFTWATEVAIHTSENRRYFTVDDGRPHKIQIYFVDGRITAMYFYICRNDVCTQDQFGNKHLQVDLTGLRSIYKIFKPGEEIPACSFVVKPLEGECLQEAEYWLNMEKTIPPGQVRIRNWGE